MVSGRNIQETYSGHISAQNKIRSVFFLHILLCCMCKNEASLIQTIHMFSAMTFLT